MVRYHTVTSIDAKSRMKQSTSGREKTNDGKTMNNSFFIYDKTTAPPSPQQGEGDGGVIAVAMTLASPPDGCIAVYDVWSQSNNTVGGRRGTVRAKRNGMDTMDTKASNAHAKHRIFMIDGGTLLVNSIEITLFLSREEGG